MQCPRCDFNNRKTANFCSNCGEPLAQQNVCPHCGHINKRKAEACAACGFSLEAEMEASLVGMHRTEKKVQQFFTGKRITSRKSQEGERKVVTIFFADVKDSTELTYKSDPEEYLELLTPAVELMIKSVHQFNGTVLKVDGDGIMALFGAPYSYEGHALHACLAGISIQQKIKTLSSKVQIRIGINSGEVVLELFGSDQRREYDAIGQPVVIAARLLKAADPEAVWLGEATYQLVKDSIEAIDRGPQHLKGLAKPIHAFQLIDVKQKILPHAWNDKAYYIGRSDLLEKMGKTIETLLSQKKGAIISIVGDPGLGKSRLLFEVYKRYHQKSQFFLTNSFAYTQKTLLSPVIQFIKAALNYERYSEPKIFIANAKKSLKKLSLNVEDALMVLAHLLHFLRRTDRWNDLSPAQKHRYIIKFCVDFIERMSKQSPLILAFEDMHWADEDTNNVILRIAEHIDRLGLVLILTYRPEYKNPLQTSPQNILLPIKPLSVKETRQLIHNLVGKNVIPEMIYKIIIERCNGNPFFAEELISILKEKGFLKSVDKFQVKQLEAAELMIPTTVLAVLTSRIDNLNQTEKKVLQAASVFNQDIALSMVKHLLNMDEAIILDSLSKLVRYEHLDQVKFLPEPEYAFRHALVRDASYVSMLKSQRVQYHQCIVDTYENYFPNSIAQNLDALAYHAVAAKMYDKAFQYASQAGDHYYYLSSNMLCLEYYLHAIDAYMHKTDKLAFVDQAMDVFLHAFYAYFKLGHYKEEKNLLDQALKIVESYGEQSHYALVFYGYSIYFLGINDYSSAEYFAKKSLLIFEKIGHKKGIVSAKFALFNCCRFTCDHNKMLKISQALLAMMEPNLEEVTDMLEVRVWSIIYFHVVWYYCEVGDFDFPRRLLKRFKEAMEKRPLSDETVVFASAVGIWHALKGDFAKAIQSFNQAKKIIPKLEYYIALPGLYTFLGYAHAHLKQLKLAKNYLNKAYQIYKEANIPFLTAATMGYLADAFFLVNDVIKAKEIVQMGLEQSKQLNLRGIHVQCLRIMAKIALHEEKDFSLIEDYYKEAIQLAKKIHTIPQIAHCHLERASFYLNRQQPKKAKQDLRTAHAIYARLHMTYWEKASLV